MNYEIFQFSSSMVQRFSGSVVQWFKENWSDLPICCPNCHSGGLSALGGKLMGWMGFCRIISRGFFQDYKGTPNHLRHEVDSYDDWRKSNLG
jgi:hypothetical protein